MATVNKDFKIKSGLIVEGTTATVNGNQVLTEVESDQYILNLIGGETLVKSVDINTFTVDGSGNLTVNSGVFDEAGAASTAEQNAKTYADGLAVNYDAAGSAAAAQQNAELYANGVADIAELNAKNYADGLAVNYDAAGSATTAENNANFYTDNAISGLGGSGTASVAGNIDVLTGTGIQVNGGNNSVEIDRQTVDTWYDAAGSASTAQQNAELYADNAIAALVDSAPATLDTLNELAAALQDNPDIITDLQDIAAGKQDTLTAGSNIEITATNVIAVTGLDTEDVAEAPAGPLYFTNSRAVDAVTGLNNSDYYPLAEKDGKAGVYKPTVASTLGTESINGSGIKVSNTNNNALAIDRTTVDTWYDAAGAASDAQTAAETFATNAINALTTDDIEEGVNNLYYTDARARAEAVNLLTNAYTENVTISEIPGGIQVIAENGVADSTTDDLAEGETNLYFTDERAIDAVSAADIYPNAVIINNLTKQVASSTLRETAGTFNGYAFLSTEYRSAEFLVKIAQGSHTEISKVLLTLDTSDNVAMTEYGIVATGETPLASITANVSLMGTVELKVTTVNNNSTVTVLGTLIA